MPAEGALFFKLSAYQWAEFLGHNIVRRVNLGLTAWKDIFRSEIRPLDRSNSNTHAGMEATVRLCTLSRWTVHLPREQV